MKKVFIILSAFIIIGASCTTVIPNNQDIKQQGNNLTNESEAYKVKTEDAKGGPLIKCGDNVCQDWELTKGYPGYCPDDCTENQLNDPIELLVCESNVDCQKVSCPPKKDLLCTSIESVSKKCIDNICECKCTTSIYKCIDSIDCMPIVPAENIEYCSTGYIDWAQKNCPGFQVTY